MTASGVLHEGDGSASQRGGVDLTDAVPWGRDEKRRGMHQPMSYSLRPAHASPVKAKLEGEQGVGDPFHGMGLRLLRQFHGGRVSKRGEHATSAACTPDLYQSSKGQNRGLVDPFPWDWGSGRWKQLRDDTSDDEGRKMCRLLSAPTPHPLVMSAETAPHRDTGMAWMRKREGCSLLPVSCASPTC